MCIFFNFIEENILKVALSANFRGFLGLRRCFVCGGFGGTNDVSLFELCAVDDPKAHGDDSGREDDRPGDGFPQEEKAVEGGEDGA